MDGEAVNQFLQVTGATDKAAHFFLESAGGNVAAAVDHYFSTGGQMDPVVADEAVRGAADPQQMPQAPGELWCSSPTRKTNSTVFLSDLAHRRSRFA